MQLQPNSLPASSIISGKNPREYFDPAAMDELVSSIREKGIIQPIIVRPVTDGKYAIVAGERRWRAAKSVSDDFEVPVVIRELDDAEAEDLALIENVQRADMSPVEEAQAAAKILARCNNDREEAAKRLGWSRTTLDKRLALMNCSDKVRQALSERKITLGHAELIAAVKRDKQDQVLEKLLTAPNMPTVLQLKANLEQIAKALHAAIFDKSDCATCNHNSGNQREMFSESIAEGHCTNGQCYDDKTEVELEARKKLLAEEYPSVRIVRPGENHTILKLVAEGATGVGDEQAKACRACQNFGAAVSAVPGKVGNIYRDQCFDPSCNAKKVAERLKAEKAEKEIAAPATKNGEAKPVKKTEASAKTVVIKDSTRVKEYRVKLWREMLRKELMANPETNMTVLLAVALSGNARHIANTKLQNAFEKLSGARISSTINEACETLSKTDEKVRHTMLMGMTASIYEGIEEHTLTRLLQFLGADVAKHWKLCEEFLNLLTKSEIEVMVDEIGLKTAMGEAYAKTMSQKKEDIIKGLLSVKGFVYEGKVPHALQYNQKQ
jgi:ParB family chromosome partitioning protein